MTKKLKIVVGAIAIQLLSITSIKAQFEQKNENGVFKGEFKAPINHTANSLIRNNFDKYKLMGESSVKFALWTFIQEPVCDYKFYWERSPNFGHTAYNYNGKNYFIQYSSFTKYPDLQKHIDFLRPLNILISAKLRFYSNALGYIAACDHDFSIDLPGSAGDKNIFSMPGSKDWDVLYKNIFLITQYYGYQSYKSKIDLSDFWAKNQNKPGFLKTGQAKEENQQLAKTMLYIFKNSDRIEVESAEIIDLQMPDIDWIFKEYCRREEKAKAASDKSQQKGGDDDFWNTTEPIDNSIADQEDFWNTTATPADVWMKNIENADALYQNQQWIEAKKMYHSIVVSNPEIVYAKQQEEYIDKLLAYQSLANNTFTDPRDGHVYKTVQIGDQVWMAENLAYKSNSACFSYNGLNEYVEAYGYLYSYETAQNVCPLGWHLSSKLEWEQLLKTMGNEYGTNMVPKLNENGFSLKTGGGAFYSSGEVSYGFMGSHGFWWCSDVNQYANDIYRMYENSIEWERRNRDDVGYSVRCVKNKVN